MASKKTAKKKAKKKVSKKKTSTRARRVKATPKQGRTARAKGRISTSTRDSIKPINARVRGEEYAELFEQMLAMDPNEPNKVLKAYPPEGMDAKKYQDRVNSAMHATGFKRPKGCTYYKQICVDDDGQQYLAIRITAERGGS